MNETRFFFMLKAFVYIDSSQKDLFDCTRMHCVRSYHLRKVRNTQREEGRDGRNAFRDDIILMKCVQKLAKSLKEINY